MASVYRRLFDFTIRRKRTTPKAPTINVIGKVIDPDMGSGYDYDSLADWESAQQGDLTGSRNEIAIAKCRCTGGTADILTSALSVDGWTTSATQYIKIWTDPSESYRHAGNYPTGNKYRIEGSAAYAATLTINESYVKLYGLALKSTHATQPGTVLNIAADTPSTSFIYIDSLVCYRGGYDVDTHVCSIKQCTAYVSNSVFYGGYHANSNAFIFGYGATGCTVYVYNCTAAKAYHGFEQGSGVTGTFKNCYAGGNSADDFYSTVTCTTCASEDTTGTSGLTGIAFSTSNFENVTDGSENFHLPSGSGLIGVGTNLYNDATYPFQTDIDGQDRGGAQATWDIGADQWIPEGSVCWGYDTGVTQDNIRNFSGEWYGTGEVVSTGDGERIELASGEYMISEPIIVPADSTVTLRKNSYFMRS